MKTKKRERKEVKSFLIIGIILTLALIFIALTYAQSQQDLQAELNQLEQEMINNNYDWLVNYNLTHPQVGVYEKDSSNLLAVFNNIANESWYKIFLTNLSECYDNETKILTEDGWKYFADLNDEKVATLNVRNAENCISEHPENTTQQQECFLDNLTGEMEWQLPTEIQSFDNNDYMYKIETEQGDLVVSEKHKVYSSVVESNLANSFELNTFIIDFLSNFSSDHSGQLYFSANARYGTSLGCSGNRLQAFGINSLNSSSGTNFILVSKIDMTSKNSSSVLCVFDNISSLLLANSTNINSGAIKCNLLETNISLASLLPLINKENNSLASTTTIIYLHPLDLSLLANASFTFLPSLNASSCVNSLSLVKDSKTLSCSTFFENASLATSDQLIILNPSILSLSSSGKDNVIFTILNSSCDEHINYVYTHVFKPFGLNKITDVYSELNSGKEIYFLNSENKPVKVNNIEKVQYSGKIYDVDVPNDIVLVRRNSNLIDNKKENEGKIQVPQQLKHILTDYNYSSDIRYLNLSDSKYGESAQVAQRLEQRSNKSWSSQTSEFDTRNGETLGLGASNFDLFSDNLNTNNQALSQEQENKIIKEHIARGEKIPLDLLEGAIWSGNSNNYTQETFDLMSLGDINKIPREIYLKKMRINQIREMLK